MLYGKENRKPVEWMDFDKWMDAVRFYASGKTKNAELPDGQRVILRKENTPKNFRVTSRDFLKVLYDGKMNACKPKATAEKAMDSIRYPLLFAAN